MRKAKGKTPNVATYDGGILSYGLGALVGIHRCLCPRNEDLGPMRGAVETCGVLPTFAGNADPWFLPSQPRTTMPTSRPQTSANAPPQRSTKVK